jgi:hypothetical protein
MQKMNNFRDQLNNQLFGESDETHEVFGSTQGNVVADDVKKEYKIPPKVFKRPELKLQDQATIGGNPIAQINPVNPLAQSEDKSLDDFFSSNKNTQNENKKFDNFSTGNANAHITPSEEIANFDTQGQKDKLSSPAKNKDNTSPNNSSQNSNNQPNMSFSEENCNSVVYSEHKNENTGIINSKESETTQPEEKNQSKPIQINQFYSTSQKGDLYGSNSEINEDGSLNSLNNLISQTSSGNMYKIEKTTKFTKSTDAKGNLSTSMSIGSSNKPTTTITVATNKNKTQQNNMNNTSTYSMGGDAKSVRSVRSVRNISQKEKIVSSEISPLEGLSSTNNNELLDSQDKQGISLTSSELSNKLEKLKNEIIELKQTKTSLESDYHVEVNKTKLYEKELGELRSNLQSFKQKEITQGEDMLKLEIENLKNSVEYKNKENDLLKKENKILSREIRKLQNYIREFFNNGKINFEEFMNREREEERYPIHEENKNEIFEGKEEIIYDRNIDENYNEDNENNEKNEPVEIESENQLQEDEKNNNLFDVNVDEQNKIDEHEEEQNVNNNVWDQVPNDEYKSNQLYQQEENNYENYENNENYDNLTTENKQSEEDQKQSEETKNEEESPEHTEPEKIDTDSHITKNEEIVDHDEKEQHQHFVETPNPILEKQEKKHIPIRNKPQPIFDNVDAEDLFSSKPNNNTTQATNKAPIIPQKYHSVLTKQHSEISTENKSLNKSIFDDNMEDAEDLFSSISQKKIIQKEENTNLVKSKAKVTINPIAPTHQVKIIILN